MQQIQKFSDSRNEGFCVYCGGPPETRDHVPSKILLNRPYPENLPIVSSCRSCNIGFSLDEEYCACLVECIICGSTDPQKIDNERVRKILNQKSAIAARLENSRYTCDGSIYFRPELERIKSVIVKLARGHAAYELSLPQLSEPTTVCVCPLESLSTEARNEFEFVSQPDLWPELGSRSMQRLLIADRTVCNSNPWLVVQDGFYRYHACEDGAFVVRGVLREYLAYEVRWED